MKNRSAITTEPPPATTPICWQRETTSACLRIELPNGEIHILPYAHLVSAHFTKSKDDTETLRLIFSTHEIQIEGHDLRDLLLGIQDFAIKWLRPVPERYVEIASTKAGIITKICVSVAE